MRGLGCGTRIMLFLVFSVLCAAPVKADDSDLPGSRDHQMFSRIPGFFIEAYNQQDAGSYRFDTGDGPITMAGRLFRIDYFLGEGADPPPVAQIVHNHVAAVEALGGEVLDRSADSAVFRIEEEKKEIWVHLIAWGESVYGLRILENLVEPPLTNLDPGAMAEAIRRDGRVALYGLQFDERKPGIHPKSGRVLEAIATLLKSHADLDLFVVGHTDNLGDLLANLNRSKRRANLIVRELINTYGIEPDRLQPYGVGPLAPVSANNSERGRAENRRFELVLQ